MAACWETYPFQISSTYIQNLETDQPRIFRSSCSCLCLPDRLDRLERNCSSCLILDQLRAGDPFPMLHWQCPQNSLPENIRGSETVVGFRKVLTTFSPSSVHPLSWLVSLKIYKWIQTLLSEMNLDNTFCHVLIHNFSENFILFKGRNWGKSFVLYCF